MRSEEKGLTVNTISIRSGLTLGTARPSTGKGGISQREKRVKQTREVTLDTWCPLILAPAIGKENSETLSRNDMFTLRARRI